MKYMDINEVIENISELKATVANCQKIMNLFEKEITKYGYKKEEVKIEKYGALINGSTFYYMYNGNYRYTFYASVWLDKNKTSHRVRFYIERNRVGFNKYYWHSVNSISVSDVKVALDQLSRFFSK